MAVLDQISLTISSQIKQILDPIKRRLFGANNETLDFVMDSFYKLSPEQRLGAIVGGSVLAVFFVFGVLFFYFSQVRALEDELNTSFNALHELRRLKKEYSREEARFNQLLTMVRGRTTKPWKPFFEEKAQEAGVELQRLNDQTTEILADNPLSTKMKYVKVDVQLPKVSIPRLLQYVTAIERSGNYMTVEDLTIRGRYGTKLFFDAQAKFRGYRVEGF